MSRVRENYENGAWMRFVSFIDGETKEGESEKEKDGQQEDMEKNLRLAKAAGEREAVHADLYHRKRERSLSDLSHMMDQYETWSKTRGMQLFGKIYRIIAFGICMLVIAVLLITVANMPEFGSPDTPANSGEVPGRYIEKGQEETGAVNIVTGMILDYRAFDTLGESHVLFIAACTVLILVRIDHRKDGSLVHKELAAEEDDRKLEPKNDKILQKSAFILVPVIILFGIYVILNGHISPGGGFSGGAIIGAGLILYLNAFGFKKTERFFTYRTFSAVSLFALLFYSVAKCYSFFCGANHLESGIPLGNAGDIISSGLILPLNICVGCVVACTMYSFYAIFRKGGI